MVFCNILWTRSWQWYDDYDDDNNYTDDDHDADYIDDDDSDDDYDGLPSMI